ncbi:MAG: DEAD/DEAH box helicase family protein [Christensenellales bacterium]
MFAEVIIDIAHAKIDRVFSYRVPEDMQLCIGDRVVVPFGAGNHPKEGYVVSFCEQTAYEPEKIKPILQKEDAFSAILPEQIALAQWMAKTYHCFLVDALRLMIPSQMRRARKGKDRRGGIGFPNADLEKALEELNGALGGRRAPAQAETLSLIAEVGKISVKELYEFLPSAKSALPQLRKKALVQTEKVAVRRAPYQALARLQKKEHTLTPDQQKAVEAVLPSLASHGGRYLLHGVTGSGKTEVYLQIIRQTLLQNKGCIVLVPEISLTPQMVARFRAFLGKTWPFCTAGFPQASAMMNGSAS